MLMSFLYLTIYCDISCLLIRVHYSCYDALAIIYTYHLITPCLLIWLHDLLHLLYFMIHYLLWLSHVYWSWYIILGMMHLLLLILATWLLYALAGLPTNNPVFVCSDLAGWSEVDLQLRIRPTSRSRRISRSSIPSSPLARFPLPAREFYLLYLVQSTFVLSSDVIFM